MRAEAAEVTFKALKVWQKPISQDRSCRSGSLLSDGEKIPSSVTSDFKIHTKYTTWGFQAGHTLNLWKSQTISPTYGFLSTKKKPWNRKASVHRQNINSSENSLPAPVAKAEANRLGKAARLNLSFKGTPTTRHGGYLCAPLTSQKPPRRWVAQIFLSISSQYRNRPKVMQRLSVINNNKTIPWPWPASNVHLAKMCFSHQVQLSKTRQKKSINLSDPQEAFSNAF